MTSTFAFTKLIVHDLERMAAFYREAYDFHVVQRVRERIGDERIEELMLSLDPGAPFGTLVLLKFVDRPARRAGGDVILGFTTDDLTMQLDRICAAGGLVHAEPREMPELHLRVAFATDPEGHLTELVQMIT